MRRLVFCTWVLLMTASPALASSSRTDELADQARAERRAGRTAAAIELLDQARAERSNDPELLGLLGLCLLDAGDTARARKLALAHERYDGDGFRLALFLGRWLLDQGRAEEAEVQLERAVALKAGAVEALLQLGRAEVALEHTSRGLEVAGLLLEIQPVLGRRLAADVHNARGERILERAARNAEAVPRALEAFQEAYALAPDDAQLAARLLDVLIQSHRAPEASALLDRVYPVETAPAEHHLYTARVAVVSNQPLRAEQAFRQLLEVQPMHADGSVGLARLLLDRGERQGAEALLTAVLERDPRVAEAHLVQGLCAVAAGEHERAEPCLRQAVELRPQDGEALYQLGRVLMRVGKAAEGRQILQRYAGN